MCFNWFWEWHTSFSFSFDFPLNNSWSNGKNDFFIFLENHGSSDGGFYLRLTSNKIAGSTLEKMFTSASHFSHIVWVVVEVDWWGFPSLCVCLRTAVYLGSAAEWHAVNNTCYHRRLTVNLPQPERPVTSSEFIAWKICIVLLGKIYYCSSYNLNRKIEDKHDSADKIFATFVLCKFEVISRSINHEQNNLLMERLNWAHCKCLKNKHRKKFGWA